MKPTNLYHLPWLVRKPLEGSLSIINRIANGFYLHDASSTAMLKQNHRPMLFIHGADDDFVPTRMVYQNYQATRGPKQLWVVKGAAHAKSFATHPKSYQKHVQKFLDQYVK
jgi:Hydrolases of the alpha/beta superfamily